jgi:hypothetical protein
MSDEFDLPIHDFNGDEFKLGLTEPTVDEPCCFAAFESQVELLDDATLKRIAQNGLADDRNIFEKPEYIAKQVGGSCNGYSASEVLRRAIIRTGESCPMLSGAYAYSLMNGGRDNGSNLNTGMNKVTQNGICTMATVPANVLYRNQYDTKKADAEAAKRKGFEAYAVGTTRGLWTALALKWDCVVAVQCGNNFNKLDANGCPGVTRGNGNHAMDCFSLLWVAGELMTVAQNHWGNWGRNGFCNFRADNVEPCLGTHTFYAVRSSQTTTDTIPQLA